MTFLITLTAVLSCFYEESIYLSKIDFYCFSVLLVTI
uniref:Uncharacterized protein n=1 Tax=Siphoviridae sp. ctHip2 TaxID=2827830 RepID=A0A8S5RW45_9CAUD|nr:MAG TPA: hypothetical protein [Siphoviridae sp. ctHip2]